MSSFEKNKKKAQEKWVATEAYKEYQEKTKAYSADKWNNISEGMNEILSEFDLCVKKDEAPDSIEAQSLVKNCRTI